MRKNLLIVAVLATGILGPSIAAAQDGAKGGTAGGAAAGAVGGAIVGGPVGAVVGGAAGALAGGAMGGLAAPDREYVTTYVRTHQRPVVRVQGDVVVGAQLPQTVTIYEIEGRPSVRGVGYAYVNDRRVIVDRGSRKVVHIVE